MDPLTYTPALRPPPGILPNFLNPQSQALMVIVACLICLVLIIPISLIRFYTSLWIKKSFKADDIVCVFAVTGSVAYTAVVLSSVNITGRHQWNVPVLPGVPAFLRKMIIVVDLMYGPVAFSAKLSLFLLYYRLFSRHRWIKYLIYLGIASNLAMYTAGIAVYGYLCLPHHGENWIQAGLSSRCHQQFIMVGYVRGPFNVLSDFYLLLLPLPAVWQLQLPIQKKFGISAIFLTGFFACIASICGLYYRVQLYKSPDLTWNLAPVLVCLVIELNVGTICACLPSLAAFYRHHRLKPSQVAAIKNLTSKISPFKSSQSTRKHRLGTHVLGSIEGEGKFMKSGEFSNITVSSNAGGAQYPWITSTSQSEKENEANGNGKTLAKGGFLV